MQKTGQQENTLVRKYKRRMYRSPLFTAAQVLETLIPRTTEVLNGQASEPFEATALECAADLAALVSAVNAGNLLGIKAFLTTDIKVLHHLHLDHLERYKRAPLADHAKWYQEKALQAQEQCRATIATLISFQDYTPQNRT